jgi:hypothetical protein
VPEVVPQAASIRPAANMRAIKKRDLADDQHLFVCIPAPDFLFPGEMLVANCRVGL